MSAFMLASSFSRFQGLALKRKSHVCIVGGLKIFSQKLLFFFSTSKVTFQTPMRDPQTHRILSPSMENKLDTTFTLDDCTEVLGDLHLSETSSAAWVIHLVFLQIIKAIKSDWFVNAIYVEDDYLPLEICLHNQLWHFHTYQQVLNCTSKAIWCCN